MTKGRAPRLGQTTVDLRGWVRERDDFTCHYCARRGGLDRDPDGLWWHIDHKTPRALGGGNAEDNLVLACTRCNLDKNDMAYDDFVAKCPTRHLPEPIVDSAPPVEAVWQDRRRQDREAAEVLARINRGELAKVGEA